MTLFIILLVIGFGLLVGAMFVPLENKTAFTRMFVAGGVVIALSFVAMVVEQNSLSNRCDNAGGVLVRGYCLDQESVIRIEGGR